MTTPLHAALGEPGAALTFDVVARAAATRVEESEQLDWKAGLHLQPQAGVPSDDTPLRLELAKDIAAMANTRGGLLVCGVREATTGPHTIRDLGDLSDGVARKQIVQVAFTHIYPPVPVDPITLVSDAGETILVISIPESDDAPHLVRPKGDKREEGWMVAPVRSGRETRNMVEKELESAYQRRFAGRRARELELRQGLLELAERHTLTPPAVDPGTVVAFARPMRPRSGPLPGHDPARSAGELISRAAFNAEWIVRVLVSRGQAPHVRQFAVLELMEDVRDMRRSLRRHVGERLAGPETEAGSVAAIFVELHDDGSVGLTWRAGPPDADRVRQRDQPLRPSIGSSDMNAFALSLISLLRVASDELGLDGGYQVTVGLWPRNTRMLVVPIRHHPREPATRVHVPAALEAELRFGSAPEVVAADVIHLVNDLCDMVGQRDEVIDRFWDGWGESGREDRLEAARGLFGGTPPHPTSGREMT